MSSEVELLVGDVAYRNMGLIGNPFKPFDTRDPLPVSLVSHAQADAFVGAVDMESREDRSRPIWVDKTRAFPEYYHTIALSEVLRSLARPETTLLGVYIPLDLFRLGRIRGTLGTVSEAVAARQFDETLAAWGADTLSEPDETLPEFAPLESLDLKAIVERLQSAPAEAVAEYFGESVWERQLGPIGEVRERAAISTESHLDRDPEESSESAEIDAEIGAPLLPESQPQEAEETQEAPNGQDPVATYLIAHARAHLSPVIARALKAYIVGGVAAVVEQLKITKAPKKTLKAVMSFAAHRYRRVVLIYDRFDAWPEIAEEGRALIVGTMTELRWIMGDAGILTMLVASDIAPELAEQFAGARKVAWDLHALADLGKPDVPFDAELVQSWIDAASLDGAAFRVDSPDLAPLVEAAGGILESFCVMACEAVESAALRGVSSLDAEAIEAGMRKGSE